MTSLVQRAVEGMEGVTTRDAQKPRTSSRSAWSLALRPPDGHHRALDRGQVRQEAARADANIAAFRAGWSFGETTELIDTQIHVDPATDVKPGTYRNVNGTQATALGLIAASVRAGLPLLLGAYPITPASELLHELSRHQEFGVRTIQAEDEIAAASIALGAAFAGSLGVTATSGPGLDLKTETIGLAVMLELPMIVIDVQRAGPSPACRPRPSSPTCCRRCTAATASPRCR